MKHAFLALLADGPRHGYELKSALEQSVGPLLPEMNTGQIYTTLQRLERDGLVTGTDVPDDTRNKRIYELTDLGHKELAEWMDTPVSGLRLKDEFFMKLVLVRTAAPHRLREVIDRQRRDYLQSLRDLAELARTVADDDVSSVLVEGAQLHVEADLHWLELCTQRLVPKEAP
jgi:DNA-binding PadR family transcriptional regulator